MPGQNEQEIAQSIQVHQEAGSLGVARAQGHHPPFRSPAHGPCLVQGGCQARAAWQHEVTEGRQIRFESVHPPLELAGGVVPHAP